MLSEISAEVSKLEQLLPLMTGPERARLSALLKSRRQIWMPLPGPQLLGYHSPADVLGYGGGAGGGKSDLLLGLAASQHRKTVIFRREATQGRGMWDRAVEIFGSLGRPNEQRGTWKDLPGGRQIELAGVKDLGDEQKWRGRPHDLVGFDEGDQFLESQFRFLRGWARTTVPGQRTRVVVCFNPPSTAEGRWLLDFFGPWINRKHPKYPTPAGVLRWYTTIDGQEVECVDGSPFAHGDEILYPKSRTFIPALVDDNPHLLRTGYKADLQALPEPLRSQVLKGDMSAGLEDAAWQAIPTAWVEAAMARWKPERPPIAQTCLGVDVARGGKDQTVLARRFGKWIDRLEKHPGRETPTGSSVAALIDPLLVDGGYAAIDAEGIGASAYDSTKGNKVAIRFGAGAGEDTKDRAGVLTFLNLRAYAYWSLREALDPEKGDGIQLPPDPELLGDLTAPRYEPRPGGIKIQDKEEIRKLLRRSTDCGDAVALTFASTVDYGLPVGVAAPSSAAAGSGSFGL